MTTCQRCDRAFTDARESDRILYDWYVHLRDAHDNDVGSEFIARVDAITDDLHAVYGLDFDSIGALLRGDLARARKVWGR